MMGSNRRSGRIGKSLTLTMRRARRGATVLGAAASLVVAIAVPAAAFPPVGAKAKGFGSTGFDDTAGTGLTRCQNEFSGRVTKSAGSGQGGQISINRISFDFCDPTAGISVTANNLPWTLKLDPSAQLTIEGVDLNIITRAGIGRYTGTLGGGRSFDGVYTISGALTRRGGSWHGPQRLGVSILSESISVNGVPLNP